MNRSRRAHRELSHPKGLHWTSRGYVPHFDQGRVVQHVVFHLGDSLPSSVAESISRRLAHLPLHDRDHRLRKQVERWLDAGRGCCLLSRKEVGQMVEGSLRRFDGDRYDLHAWVVMPNHVHVVLESRPGWELRSIVASWKRFTGRRIRELLVAGRVPGVRDLQPVWHPEYFDRFVRDCEHYRKVVRYVENNPVRAGLVAVPEQWPWTSAGRCRE